MQKSLLISLVSAFNVAILFFLVMLFYTYDSALKVFSSPMVVKIKIMINARLFSHGWSNVVKKKKTRDKWLATYNNVAESKNTLFHYYGCTVYKLG